MVAMFLSILTALLPVLLSVAAQLSMRGASLVGHSVHETHNSSPDYDRPAALFGGGVTTHVTASARKSFVRSRQLQDALQITFREIVDGPLSDRTVTLLVDAEVEEVIHIDQLLAGVSTPLSLLRTSNKREGYNTIQEGDSHLTSQDEVDDLKVEQHNDTQDKRHNKLILSSNVLVVVMMVGMEVPWPLARSPGWSSPSALLLLNLSPHCRAALLLQTALLQQTPLVALLCPTPATHSLAFTLYTWRPFHPHTKLVALGPWNLSHFPVWDELFQDRFSSFYGATLHVASDDADMPYVYRNSAGEFDGVGKRMTDALGGWIDFHFTMTQRASDKMWGQLVNGSWQGMLGDVWRGDKDLAFNYFTITEERNNHFDYSVPYYNEGYGFSLTVPPALPRWRNLIYPFSGRLWAGVGGLLLLVSLSFYTIAHVHTRLSLPQCLLCTLQSLIGQVVSSVPRAWSLRLFLASWWLTAYVIVISYTCNLIAVLTVPVFPSRIATLQQLAKSPYRVCMLDYGEFVDEALATSRDPVLSALGAKLDLVPMLLEIEHLGEESCVDLVLGGAHAHLEAISYLKLLYSVLGHSHLVYFMKEQIYKANLAFFFRKNTAWKYKFDQGIQALVESGLVQKWYEDTMGDITKKIAEPEMKRESAEERLSLAHVQGPFLLLLAGLLSSLMVFLWQYLQLARHRQAPASHTAQPRH